MGIPAISPELLLAFYAILFVVVINYDQYAAKKKEEYRLKGKKEPSDKALKTWFAQKDQDGDGDLTSRELSGREDDVEGDLDEVLRLLGDIGRADLIQDGREWAMERDRHLLARNRGTNPRYGTKVVRAHDRDRGAVVLTKTGLPIRRQLGVFYDPVVGHVDPTPDIKPVRYDKVRHGKDERLWRRKMGGDQ